MEGILRSANERASQASFKQSPRKVTAVDEELEELLTKQKAKIKVIGCGGGGNNTINRMSEVGIAGTETVVRFA